MSSAKKQTIFFMVLIALSLLVVILATGIGAISIHPRQTAQILVNIISSGAGSMTGGWLGVSEWTGRHGEWLNRVLNPEPVSETIRGLGTMAIIIWNVRVPRVLLGFLIGASLAAAGAAFQGLLQNPLADPYTIGVSSGAALGATIAMLFLPAFTIAASFTIPLFGFIGAGAALLMVYQLSRVGGRLPVVTVLLSGVIISSFFSALISMSMIFAGEQMRGVFYWLVGGLSMRGWPYVGLVLLYLIPGLVVLMYYARDLNLILLGEDEALSLGVETEQVKKIVLGAGALITAGAVAFSGMIGFVGLIVPHAMRMLIGPDHRKLFPAAALGGGIFLVAADTFARTILAPVEIPVGIITAFIGAPFFLYLLRRSRDKYRF